MTNQTFIEAISDIVAFATGVSVGAADAVNSTQQAVAEQATSKKVIATAGAANDLFGVVTGGMQQTLQQFSATSEEATRLLGEAGARSSVLGLSISGLPIVSKIFSGNVAKITSSELDALSGAALLAGAVVLPEAAAVLTVTGSLMIAASIFDTNSDHTIGNALAQLKNLIQPYYSQLAPSDQAAFAEAMSDAMQSTLSGGMLVPQVNDAGWITGYTAEKPTSVNPNGNGTEYTFASGVTYIAGTVTDDDPLTDSPGGSTQDVWTIPETSTNNTQTLDIHQDGSYTNRFTDSAGNRVTEIYITGSSASYTVAPMSGDYQFIYVAGTNDQITIHGDSNCISLADNNHITLDGANNAVHAGAGTTIDFGPADGNIIYNDITGEHLSVAGGTINVTGALNGGCGGEEVTLGTTNHLTINADGSKTLTLRYDGDDRVYHRTYNAAGVQTEVLVINPDGGYGDQIYDAATGLETQAIFASADGSGFVMKFNAAQQLIEQDYIRVSGPSSQFLKDPVTGQTIAFNTISGGPLPHLDYDPGTDTVTWNSQGNGAVLTAASAHSESDHQAVQLIQAMAAYAPASSVSTSLQATPSESSQLMLAASVH
ncbi:DUF3060 domain-containing protein [Paraburkholderia xenovorans]|uniref:DUF3060 domain-containing protein n=1 Tax=Paraburkholderia xenovorans TaxID=36873 RepID=UPI0038B864C2